MKSRAYLYALVAIAVAVIVYLTSEPIKEIEDERPIATDSEPEEKTDADSKTPPFVEAFVARPAEPESEPVAAGLEAIPFEQLVFSDFEEVDLATASDQHSHKIREWKGRMQPSLEELRDKIASETENSVLAFSLPDGSRVRASGLRFQTIGGRQGVFTGKVLGSGFGEIVLSYVNEAVAGSIKDPENESVWEIRNAGSGLQYVAQVDVNALGECGVCAEHGRGN